MARIFQLPRQTPLDGGAVSPGALATFYLTGTTTKTNTYTDDALTTPHSNPVVADSAGVFATIYLDPDIDHKLKLEDSTTALIYTVDPVMDTLTQANIGKIFYPVISGGAEETAGVTIVDFSKIYGNVLRYGENISPGTTNMTTAVQNALTVDQKRVFSDSSDALFITAELTSSIADRVIDGLNLATDGSIAGADFMLVSSGARTIIKNCTFDGIAVTTDCSALEVSGTKTKVIDCTFTDFDNGYGVHCQSTASKSRFIDNEFNNVAPVQINAQIGAINCNADKCKIHRNDFFDVGQTGISLNGPDHVKITKNYIEGKTTGTTSGGIILDGKSDGCLIDGNTVNGCKVEGIQIHGSVASYGSPTTGNIVTNNNLYDCEYSAISLNGDAIGDHIGTICSNNNIKYVSATARAFELIRLSDSTISNNDVYGYNIGINMATAQSPDNNITGNTFNQQDSTAIQVYGQGCLVTGNKITGDGGAGSTTGIIFNGPANGGEQLIEGNQIGTCHVAESGTFSGSERTYLRNNHFLDNGTDISYTSDNPNSSSGNVFDGGVRGGSFTLVAGTATINNTALAAGDRIVLSLSATGGTGGAVYISARTDTTSFVVTSTSGSDTSTYDYEFVR